MTQIINKSLLIFLFFIISNCGYKILDNLETNNFNIKEISTSGDKRVNFKIKNSLIVDSSKNRTNNLIIELDTKKIKKIKEKNIKNEITKYKISLISNIKLNFLEKNQEHKFSITSSGDYLAANKYSTTIKNEKRLIEDLTNDLSNKIKNKINLITNDF
jgi:outer membrane lipopolysaccharide assembly protein LptE/RlpB